MVSVKIKAFLLDMDGVLYQGQQRLFYALEFLQRFQQVPKIFITNNPIRSPQGICEKLAAMGISEVSHEQIVTSAMATAAYLNQRRPNFRYYAIGAPGLREELDKWGVYDPHHADYVVVGEGAGLDFDTLTIGINLILKQGAELIGTNPDNTVDHIQDGQHQILPGGGALIAPFIEATGQQPVIIGKPQPLLYQMALEKLSSTQQPVVAEQCLMIGDRPDTDILGAAQLGLRTALVRSGRFSINDAYPSHLPLPDLDFPDLEQLAHHLGVI